MENFSDRINQFAFNMFLFTIFPYTFYSVEKNEKIEFKFQIICIGLQY